ncbi:MAG: hypothetical protein IKS19_03315 [Clostridia bacterium]|nr:hypothetical protein [Clostridia bacterium]
MKEVFTLPNQYLAADHEAHYLTEKGIYRLRYGLFIDEKDQYGVIVTQYCPDGTIETARTSGLGPDRDFAESVLRILCDNKASPTSVRDVIEDIMWQQRNEGDDSGLNAAV